MLSMSNSFTSMSSSDPIWYCLTLFDHVCPPLTHMTPCDSVWPYLTLIDPIWPCLNPFEPSWTHFNSYGLDWATAQLSPACLFLSPTIQNPTEGSVLQTWYLALGLNSQNQNQLKCRMVSPLLQDGHPPSQIYTLIKSVNFNKYLSSLIQFNFAV